MNGKVIFNSCNPINVPDFCLNKNDLKNVFYLFVEDESNVCIPLINDSKEPI